MREADTNRIIYSGGLQSATNVSGPWTDVAGAVSPHMLNLDRPQRFYRTREFRAEDQPIFANRSVVNWTLAAPFQSNFDRAFAGLPDGIFPPRRETPYFAAFLTMGKLEIPVEMRVRGNSSLQECPFPKLKMKIAKSTRQGTSFEDAREIKIGTHCAEGGHGNIGRLRDERATYREALAYEIMEFLGFTSPRVRRVRIEYRDTSPTNELGSTQWQVTRNAVILDDVEVVGQRLGGVSLTDEEVAALKGAHFDEQLVSDLKLFHAFLGNWDFELPVDGQGLRNTEVVRLADGKLLPVAGDFDLASWVTEEVRLRAPRDYQPELAALERNMRFDVEQLSAQVKPELFSAGKLRFMSRRAGIESLIHSAEIDDAGRTNAIKHVTTFFSILETTQQSVLRDPD